jgi:hypothetical protein
MQLSAKAGVPVNPLLVCWGGKKAASDCRWKVYSIAGNALGLKESGLVLIRLK